MALRLDDLKSKNKISPVVEFSNSDYEQYTPAKTLADKNAQLRPWQGSDSIELETRTYAANEAVLRAREKVKNNEKLAHDLREGFVSAQMVDQLKEQQDQRDKFFNFRDQVDQADQARIRTSSVFVKFFRDLVRQ